MKEAQSANSPYPNDRYWALEPGEKAIGHLYQKRREFYNVLEESGLNAKIRRNYDYHHGDFFRGRTRGGERAIVRVQETGTSLIDVNEFRSHVSHLAILVTENPPAWDTMATSSSHLAIQQTIFGNDLLDHEMDGPHHTEEHIKQVVEDAIIFTAGYQWTFWDFTKGTELSGSLDTGEMLYEGDLTHENPSFYDVIYPWEFPWRQKDWVLVFRRENRWNLVAQYPQQREEILRGEVRGDDAGIPGDFVRVGIDLNTPDLIEVGYFYHLKSPAVKYGRRLKFVGKTVLEDTLQRVWGDQGGEVIDPATTPNVWSEGMPQQEPEGWEFVLPVHRVIPSKHLLTSFGYTVAFDLQGGQEALNAELSTIINNHKNFGTLRVWQETGDTPNVEALDEGSATLIQSRKPPQVLDTCRPIPEAFQLIQLLRAINEAISGVNAIARGIPQDRAMPGVSLALIDQKAQQAASQLIANYYQFMSDVGTAILQFYKKYAKSKRVMPVIGVDSRSAMVEWSAGDLSMLERVAVKAGNPLSRTVSGRVDLAKFLAENGYVKNTQEILTVLTTGQYKPMLKADLSELSIIHDENERLLKGLPVRVSPLENLALHLREQHAILDSTELRQDPNIAPKVVTHLEQTMAMLKDPGIQEMQLALGYTIPPVLLPTAPGVPSGPGIPGGVGPGGPGEPGGLGTLGGPPRPPGGPPAISAGPLSSPQEPTGGPPDTIRRLPVLPSAVSETIKDARMRGRLAVAPR